MRIYVAQGSLVWLARPSDLIAEGVKVGQSLPIRMSS